MIIWGENMPKSLKNLKTIHIIRINYSLSLSSIVDIHYPHSERDFYHPLQRGEFQKDNKLYLPQKLYSIHFSTSLELEFHTTRETTGLTTAASASHEHLGKATKASHTAHVIIISCETERIASSEELLENFIGIDASATESSISISVFKISSIVISLSLFFISDDTISFANVFKLLLSLGLFFFSSLCFIGMPF